MKPENLSEIIREFEKISVESLFIAAHGRKPTVQEVADVSEYVERKFPSGDFFSFDEVEEILDSMAEEEEPAPVAVAIKTKPKSRRKYSKRNKDVIDWWSPDARAFLNIVLDGKPYDISYSDIEAYIPNFSKVKFTVFATYLRNRAKFWGYKTCTVRNNKELGKVIIHAISSTDPA